VWKDVQELKLLLMDPTKKLMEGPHLEFKESAKSDAYLECLDAFLNSDGGGTVLLGVCDDGSIVDDGTNVGVGNSTVAFLDKITNKVVTSLSIHPQVEPIDVVGGRVIAITVDGSTDNLIPFKGRYYERVGATTREMDPQKVLDRRMLKKPWDSIITEYSYDEIDCETVTRVIKQAVDAKRLPSESINDPCEVTLEKLNLASQRKISNGAILLFGKEPEKYFPYLKIRLGRFNAKGDIIDDKLVGGNLFHQLNTAFTILQQHIGISYKIQLTLERKDVRDYPLPALREALLNAVAHRNYADVANPITVKTYDDHVWIANPGGLLEGLTVDDLKKQHQSRRRNPAIAHVLFLAGYIENFGTGTLRIMNEMHDAGLPEPEFKEEMGGFSLYLYKDVFADEIIEQLNLSDRQTKAIHFVKDKGKITNTEYQKLTAVSKTTASRELATLVKMQLLSQRGTTGKGTYYVLYTPLRIRPSKRKYDLIPDKKQRMERSHRKVLDTIKSEIQKLVDERGSVNIHQITDELAGYMSLHALEAGLGELLDVEEISVDEHGYYHVIH
jgi:ATP-dependent DNA helicase RecG